MNNKKKCLCCDKILAGRADKKFCSDYCRATYYYGKKSDFIKFRNRVHEILKKNRDILAEINTTGKCVTSKSVLGSKGYNFCHFTNIYRTKGGNVYWLCYDYGFRKIQKGNAYLLVRWQEYMNK
ncbi:hypothetical protein ES708_14297 [subsurface metagenome]